MNTTSTPNATAMPISARNLRHPATSDIYTANITAIAINGHARS
jgi:hypothetical protein